MSWESVDINKATDKQIKYAESLLEALYGDINIPIYSMTKSEISNVIDESKRKCTEQNIEYHEQSREPIPSVETAVRGGTPLTAVRRPVSAVQEMIDRTATAARETQRNQLLAQIRREAHREVVRDEYTGYMQVRMSWRDFRAMHVVTRQTLLDECNPSNLLIDINEELVREIARNAIQEQERQERQARTASLTGCDLRRAYYYEYATINTNPFTPIATAKTYGNTFFGDSEVELILRGDE